MSQNARICGSGKFCESGNGGKESTASMTTASDSRSKHSDALSLEVQHE